MEILQKLFVAAKASHIKAFEETEAPRGAKAKAFYVLRT